MKTVSRQTESKLTACVEKVSECVAIDGISPTDALTKVAAEMRLLPGHIRVVANAFNAGQTLAKLESGTSTVEKAASVPLADGAAAVAAVYPQKVATVKEQSAASWVSPEYDEEFTGYERQDMLDRVDRVNRIFEETTIKAASMSEESKPWSFDELREANAALNELREKAAAVECDIRRLASEIGDYFNDRYHTADDIVRENISLTMGKQAAAVFDSIMSTRCQVKYASARTEIFRADDEPYKQMRELMAKIAEFKQVRSEYPTVFDKAMKHAKRADAILGDGIVSTKPIYGSILSKEASMPGLFAAQLGANAVNKLKLPSPEQEAKKMVADELMTPQHEDKIRAIRVNTLLHDLALSDPVISKYNFDEVVDAYNQVSQLAPNASLRRSVVQSLLRRYLEQGNQLDVFDQDQLVQLNRRLSPEHSNYVNDPLRPNRTDRKSL